MQIEKLKITEAKKKNEEEWNNYLKNKKQNIPINYFSWSEIISSTFFFQKPLFLIVKNHQNNIKGILSAFIVYSPTGKKTLYSSRFGLVADDKKVCEAIFKYIDKIKIEKKITNILITSGFKKYDSKFNSIEKTTMTLSLLNDVDWLWKKLSPKTRNTIRRGYKNDYEFSNDNKFLHGFYKIYKKKMFEKNLLTLPFSYFHKILKTNCNFSKIFVVHKNHKVIAGLILLFDRNGAQYTYAADDNTLFKNNMHCLLWEVIKFLYKKKISFFDMTESSLNSGVYFFKKYFGCEAKTVFYYTNTIQIKKKEEIQNLKNTSGISKFLKDKINIHFSRII